MRRLESRGAVEQLQQCIQTLLDSESHLLNRSEEMNDEILQHKELEVKHEGQSAHRVEQRGHPLA